MKRACAGASLSRKSPAPGTYGYLGANCDAAATGGLGLPCVAPDQSDASCVPRRVRPLSQEVPVRVVPVTILRLPDEIRVSAERPIPITVVAPDQMTVVAGGTAIVRFVDARRLSAARKRDGHKAIPRWLAVVVRDDPDVFGVRPVRVARVGDHRLGCVAEEDRSWKRRADRGLFGAATLRDIGQVSLLEELVRKTVEERLRRGDEGRTVVESAFDLVVRGGRQPRHGARSAGIAVAARRTRREQQHQETNARTQKDRAHRPSHGSP